MKTANLVLRVFALFLGFAATANATDASQPQFTFRRPHLPGAQSVIPNAINNNGVAVGTYVDNQSVTHGYMFDGTNLITLDDPNGYYTSPQGIPFNSEGVVVGYYFNLSGVVVGFVYDTATQQFTDVPGPVGATGSAAGGVNDQGWISGYYYDSQGYAHGFLLQGTTYSILDPPGSFAAYAYGINNNGDVAITWLDSDSLYEGAIYNRSTSTYTIRNVPGATLGTEASYLNNKGDITFWWYDSNFLLHSALYTEYSGKFTFYTFDYPHAYQTTVNGINDNKAFAGWFEGQQYGSDLGYIGTFK